MLPSEVPRLTTDLPMRVFPGVWKFLSLLRLPSQDGSLCLDKEMATHSSILAWRIPWMEELSGLQSTGRKESDRTE